MMIIITREKDGYVKSVFATAQNKKQREYVYGVCVGSTCKLAERKGSVCSEHNNAAGCIFVCVTEDETK